MPPRNVQITYLLMILLWTIPIQAQAQFATEGAPTDTPDPEQLVETALAKIEAGDIDEASRLYDQALRLKPTMIKLKLLEGLLYLESIPKRGAEALTVLGEYNASKEGGRDHRGFLALGRLYLDSRMYQQAQFPLEKAKQWAPPTKELRAEIASDLAMAYAGQKRMKKAIETAQEAAAAAPANGDIQLRLGEVAVMADESDLVADAARRAIAVFNNKLRDDPFNKDAYEKLIRCYELLSALHQYYLRTDPDNGEYYHQAAILVVEMAEIRRRYELLNARDLIVKAIEKNPQKIQWQLDAAKLELELGGLDEARNRLGKVLRDAPDNEQALRLKQRLEALQTPGKRP